MAGETTAVSGPSLAAIDLFRHLSDESRERLAALITVARIPKGGILVRDGEYCEVLYSVASGLVKVFKLSPDGKEQIISLAQPGGSFNVLPVLERSRARAWAQTLQETTLYALEAEDLATAIEQMPDLSRALLKDLTERVWRLVDLVEDLSLRRAPARVARILLGGTGDAVLLTEQEVAALAGTARETVGRILSDLKGLEAVSVHRGKIVVRRPEVLRALL